jgi:hypothetical protein
MTPVRLVPSRAGIEEGTPSYASLGWHSGDTSFLRPAPFRSRLEPTVCAPRAKRTHGPLPRAQASRRAGQPGPPARRLSPPGARSGRSEGGVRRLEPRSRRAVRGLRLNTSRPTPGQRCATHPPSCSRGRGRGRWPAGMGAPPAAPSSLGAGRPSTSALRIEWPGPARSALVGLRVPGRRDREGSSAGQ